MVTTEANCRRFNAPYLKSKYFPILWRFKDIQICKYNVRVRHGGDDDDIEPLCEMVHDTCENKKWNKREFCETIKQRNYFQRLVQCAQTNAYLWWRRRRRLTSSNEREPFCRCTSYHRHTHTRSPKKWQITCDKVEWCANSKQSSASLPLSRAIYFSRCKDHEYGSVLCVLLQYYCILMYLVVVDVSHWFIYSTAQSVSTFPVSAPCWLDVRRGAWEL